MRDLTISLSLSLYNRILDVAGTRFAYTQTKAGLVALLDNYEVVLSPKTSTPLEYDPTANILTSKCGIWLKIRHRRGLTNKFNNCTDQANLATKLNGK